MTCCLLPFSAPPVHSTAALFWRLGDSLAGLHRLSGVLLPRTSSSARVNGLSIGRSLAGRCRVCQSLSYKPTVGAKVACQRSHREHDQGVLRALPGVTRQEKAGTLPLDP